MNDFHKFLKDINSKGYIDNDTLKTILEDKDFGDYFQESKTSQKKSSSERAGDYDADKCQARIWKEGFDNIQCEHSKVDGCFCKRHANKVQEHGNWWLGLITETRPEHPVHYNGTIHNWKKDKCEIITDNHQSNDDEKPKRKRGRPPGSKNKNKKKSKKKKEEEDFSTEELIALISQKEKELDIPEKDDNTFILDGVSYFKNEDGTILDTNDFSLIGSINQNDVFTFKNIEAEDKHKLKIDG